MGALSSPLIFLRCILRRPPSLTTTANVSSFYKTTPSSFYQPILTRSFCTITSTPIVISEDTVKEEEDDVRLENEHQEMMSKLRKMSVKEKKELGSYANSLGKKLKSQQVGKSGVTHSVALALLETLEANELLKLKIHNNCPGELDEVVSRLEEATGSVVVGRIGRTIIIYRPSLTKLKAEEKKKQNMKLFRKRRAAYNASYQGRMQSRGQSSTSSNRTREFSKS